MGKQINDPLGILTSVSKDTEVAEPLEGPGNGKDPLGILAPPVKKNDNTPVNLDSESGLSGLPEDGSGPGLPKPAKQESAPSSSPGGGQFPLTEALRKRFASTITEQIPMALAQASAGTQHPDTYEEFARKSSYNFPLKKDIIGLTRKEAEEKFGEEGSDWVKSHIRSLFGFPDTELTFKKILDKAYEIAGPNATQKQISYSLDEAYRQQIHTSKKELLTFADQKQAEANKKLKGVVQSTENIKDVKSALSYAGGTIGQTAGLLPLTVTTGPAGMIAMEKGEGYNTALTELSKSTGLTRDEIINQGLDKEAEKNSDVTGVINGALESIGDLAVFGRFIPKGTAARLLSKILVKNKLASTVIASGVEGTTELLQQLDTQLGAKMAAGKTLPEAMSEIGWKDLKEDFYGGAVGGGGVHGIAVAAESSKTTPEVIAEEKTKISSTADIPAIEKSAEKIIEQSKITPEEGAQNDRQNEQRVSSEIRKGQEPIQAEPEQGGSVEAPRTSGVVQSTPTGEQTEKVNEAPEPTPETPGSGLATGAENTSQETVSPEGQQQSTETQPSAQETVTSTPEGKEQVFVYGTLRDPETRKKALGEDVVTSKNIAQGEEKKQGEFSSIEPAEGKEVHGQVMNLTPEQVKKLDSWEEKYTRHKVTLKDGTTAWAYSRKPEINPEGQQKEQTPAPVAENGETQTPEQNEQVAQQEQGPGGPVTQEGSEGGGRQIQPPPASEQGSGGVPVTPMGTTAPEGSIEGTRQFAVARRIEASDASEAIKRGIKEQGDRYVPKGLNVTEQEATDLVDFVGQQKAELMIKSPLNGLTPDTRVVIAGKLYENYAAAGLNSQAVDIAIWAENYLLQAGRAANAGKFWKMITSSGEDQIVLAIERQQQQQAENKLESIREGVTKSRDQIESEIRRLVEKRVQETVGERLEKAKLITKEKKKEIGDFFDSLKVNTKNNIMTASVLPIGVLPHVWNAAVDIIKTAVLTGADVANAIQAGVDYIKANQKEPFDEQKFRDELTPKLQAIMPKQKIKSSDIDESKIETPKISGKKKQDFINKVVDAYNEGKLDDKTFDKIYASKLGFHDFTQEERTKIRNLAKMISEAEQYEDELRKLPPEEFTREKIVKLKGLMAKAQEANTMLQEFSTEPSNVWDTLISIMQANLMSSMSLVANVFYNMTYQPLRFSSAGIGSIVDYGMSKMAKLGLLPKTMKDRTIDMKALQKGYFAGGWSGFMEGLKQVKTGTQADEKNLREIHSNFNPGRAIDRWKDKDRNTAQKINDAIEGTLGIEAEAVFRLLNLGDKPWKRAAELARAHEIAGLKGLKGKALEKFLAVPDAESQAEIIKAGQEATFQQSTEGTKKIQSGISWFLNHVASIPIIGGPAKVILKSQVPFIKTPLNLIVETIQYAAPPATFAVGAYKIAKGNKRTGSILVGKAFVGTMIWSVATQLFLKGLLTGDDDKDKKKRDFQSQSPVPPANSVNTTAISRGLAGEGWDSRPGDTWVSYTRMGVLGICFDNYSNIYKQRILEKGTISGGPEDYVVDMMESGPRILSSTIDQTFLQGTSMLLEAVKSGNEKAQETWLIKTTEAVGSILYPNTLATLSKASDEYTRDTEDKEFLQKLANVYKTKIFVGDQLPAKVNLWGEKITGNPEGRNKYTYYLFDPSKFKNVDTNDYRYQLYQAFKKDYDGDWLPSMPTRKISVDGQSVALTPKEYEEFCINVGKERADLVSSYINSGMGADQDDATRKQELKMRYDEGYELGKEKFMMDHGMNVKFKFHKPMELRSLTREMNKVKKQ